MDDFLHNLRSGKLKQPDRARRDYTDYKGPQRRAGSERRRTDYYAKVTGENFALVKDALESLAEQQKRMANALVARKSAESRIADALEAIATMLGQHLGIEVPLPANRQTAGDGPDDDMESASASSSANESATKRRKAGRRSDEDDRSDLQRIIAEMRESGESWEKIARHLADQGVPTISGKGIWRGPAVKKFWDTHADGQEF